MKDLFNTFKTSKLKDYLTNPINIGKGKILIKKIIILKYMII